MLRCKECLRVLLTATKLKLTETPLITSAGLVKFKDSMKT